jgi:hypothetical protein
MIPKVGNLAASLARASVHPGSVAPAAPTRNRTHSFLNNIGSKPGMQFNAS